MSRTPAVGALARSERRPLTDANRAITIGGMVATREGSQAKKRPAKKAGGARTAPRGESLTIPGRLTFSSEPRKAGARVVSADKVPLRDVLSELSDEHPDTALTDTEAAAAREFLGALIASRTTGAPGWAELLGPVTTPKVLTGLLNISRQALDKARNRGDVLGVRTSSGNWVYPLRQLRATAGRVQVRDGLSDVLRTLYAGSDHAGAARWLATPNRLLDNTTPWDALEAGGLERVVAAAESQVQAWTGR